MYSSSNIISKAIKYYKPKQIKFVKTRISVGKQKTSFYLTDSDYYWNVYLKSDHWKELRSKKLLMNLMCEVCGTDKHLDVHHISYKNLYDVTVSDLKTLCRKCHVGEHNKIKEEIPITFQQAKSRLRNVRRCRWKKKGYNPLDDELFKQEELYLEGLKLKQRNLKKPM
jgi:hypothetical protein